MTSVNYTLGSVHGRFQVLHNEHLEYISAAFRRCEHLVIGIANPERDHVLDAQSPGHRGLESENPLTFLERSRMIQSVLLARCVEPTRWTIVPFPIDTPQRLPEYLPRHAVCMTTICDEWNLTKVQVLRRLGYAVDVLFDRRGCLRVHGRTLRESIRCGDERWRDWVPLEVQRYLERNGILMRIRAMGAESLRTQ